MLQQPLRRLTAPFTALLLGGILAHIPDGPLGSKAQAQGFLQNIVQDSVSAFAESDIVFQRSGSNAPFFPIAYTGGNSYAEAQIINESTGETLEFSQQTAAAGGAAPFLLNKRDALFTGAYLSTQRFETSNDVIDDFRVDTVGIPLGFFRQVNPEWQAAAFVMPLGHRSNQAGSDWTLQTMGGVFTRYTRNERLWWAFGVFADHNPNSSYVLPYVGASWVINPQWTLSAVMPWPNIRYSPTRDWTFSLGASPSGAAWSLQPLKNEIAVSLDAWDFGLTAERRLFGNLWIAARSGIGGLRGVRLNTDRGALEDLDVSVGASGFFSLSLNLRPAMLP